ncbi:pirin family protein [Haloechinothrix sp. LS1_15]|uniref:pirin family protein n=1 Tax=Haloechinothrix sp. LS1_15 TaxID=2652248 RepID=UPI002944DEDE|nr:pirin family protein [Haloechinothrix sp. LS1_15]MDV6012204.1 pirin family protein [Haloechinothrix sp. LS1_15]
MPAISVANPLLLPRITRPGVEVTDRAPRQVVTAAKQTEGAGFQVRRPFPSMELRGADPFILLDHLGEVAYEPHEAKGAPWHPHRGFETVTYLMDGVFVHHDSHGGGGVIAEGDTQWMTAGSGVLHDELPAEELVLNGGWFHGVQLWVNLPRSRKWVDPRYQDLRGSELTLLTSDDGGALVRLIAGELDGHQGPGSTYTPIRYAHASLAPGAQLATPWPAAFTAMVYVLSGSGSVGAERRPLREGQLAVLDTGDAITVTADGTQDNRTGQLEVLLLGGEPIGEPVIQYGPFVMNDEREIMQAMHDYQTGRMGTVPAEHRGTTTSGG